MPEPREQQAGDVPQRADTKSSSADLSHFRLLVGMQGSTKRISGSERKPGL